MCLPVSNLLNFELPPANRSKYVLTSPRSLKACRRAGIKPIELLYRSLSNVESETGDKEHARILFEAYEVERQRKLAVCRSLRNELLLKGYWSSSEESNQNDERQRKYSSRLQHGRPRKLPSLAESYEWKRADTPENMRRIKEPPDSPKTHMSLPKVNVVFDRNAEGRLERNDVSQISNNPRGRIKNDNRDDIIQEFTENNSSAILKIEDKKPAELIENEDLTRKRTEYTSTLRDLELTTNPHFIALEIGGKDNGSSDNNTSLLSPKYSETEDINNNNIKIQKKRRPTSATKRKASEKKKHVKAFSHKKPFQNLKIQYSDPEYCFYKYKQVIENSVERDLKELDVQRTQRELDLGMERWQDRVLLLQWLDAARATEQVSKELELKVERLQQKNRSKTIIHNMNINKVREAEDLKAEGLRKQVEDKKRKIKNLQQERDRIIFQSKSRALSIQELKGIIRSIETPETFDQKVAKVNIQRKVLSSQMCARTMQRSHIWLG